MFVWWAGNMRGCVQMCASGWLVLLLLLLSGLSSTVLCQDEDADPEGETEDEATQGYEEAAEEEVASESLDTTPIPGATDATNTEEVNEEERGSGRGLGAASPESTSEPTFDTGGTSSPVEEGVDLLLIVIPVVLIVLFIAIIVCCIVINRKLNSNTSHSEFSKEDPYLEGSSTEKVPMPMFEEDVPSVLELEMEDLDGWIKKDGQLTAVNEITLSTTG
ncbi:transmembrane protein 154 isoform X1 [Periophthalmus magnuspinnatus]|uniref:transmembrane protein 154 isoform X1 n=1 Tax=Periophthalmus magnuspinnatus TaxID=409849 RepID=UPI002436E52C|nr:transmembrane protein 154 isoform X1 [Periophthalmus magnuspinnatus]